MIRLEHNYTAFNPKKTKTGKTMFSMMDYDSKNPQAKRYVTVFCDNDIEIYDRQKIKIITITGISLGEYNGKQQVSMFAKVEVEGVEKQLEQMVGEVQAEISPDDLPF